MKFAVIQFPGSNCDLDMYHAIKDELGQDVEYVWHDKADLSGFDAILLPGGFSYGDYLRCGAIAQFSNIMAEVKQAAAAGKPIWYLVPDGVVQYIAKHRLYRGQGDSVHN